MPLNIRAPAPASESKMRALVAVSCVLVLFKTLQHLLVPVCDHSPSKFIVSLSHEVMLHEHQHEIFALLLIPFVAVL